MAEEQRSLVAVPKWQTTENLLAGVVQGRYLPTWIWFIKYALFIALNPEVVKKVRLLWQDYIRLLTELEEKNSPLYHKWLAAVARKLAAHLAERPSEYSTSFVVGRGLRAAARPEAGVGAILVAVAQSALFLGISAIPKAYLTAVIEASSELGNILARAATEDRMLLRSAVKVARDLLPIAARLAQSSGIALPIEESSWPKQVPPK